MALKVRDDGTIVIKTDKEAKEALKAFRDLKAERDAAYEENGIKDMDKDLVAYKASVQNYMIQNKKKSLQGQGFHGTLVEGFDGHWDTAKLRKILKKKANFKEVWARVTKRVINPEGLAEVVDEGLVKQKEIQAAWVETPRKPYLRLFEDGDDDA